ncbi:MAG TPA: Amuc_1100 family pilus-like protein [Candidatus Acidoferrales bacterium]|nr:Amuc_1100 family pilus-like protein [Candidatus Acidoferrales bacterium]
MGWIKRNLMFAIGGVVALLLLLGAGFCDWRSWDHNSTAFDRLNEIYGKLKELSDKKPSPGNKEVDNIKAAKDQEAEVRAWIAKAADFFQPISPIPDAPEVTSEAFASDLRRTIDQLQHAAESASVQLPPKYSFSFEAQRSSVKFTPGSLAPLAVQLGEVKKIAEILFAARINALDSIQRVRVSDDDNAAGQQADYTAEASITNNLAVMTPYVITFRSFSPELASVLSGFGASPNCMIVKAINVAPAGATTQMSGGPSPYNSYPNPYPNPYVTPPGYPQGGPGIPPPPPALGTVPRGALATVLNEQILRITLEVIIVKPLPKK